VRQLLQRKITVKNQVLRSRALARNPRRRNLECVSFHTLVMAKDNLLLCVDIFSICLKTSYDPLRFGVVQELQAESPVSGLREVHNGHVCHQGDEDGDDPLEDETRTPSVQGSAAQERANIHPSPA
jgi:hypothetical protein